ncbi:uncharacterized protein PRCAT00002820001 [Priceomyces carsonii]|uniref:uncharacterized protein n=1 Tax=Priceomyces carsonii TaxID=28549 RepID=UPI002ED88EB6|nr:unnamed protein product [Priceomyces carsonii]
MSYTCASKFQKSNNVRLLRSIIGIIIGFLVILGINRLSLFVKYSKTFTKNLEITDNIHDTERNYEFQLKHIFHHGAGPNNYRIHKRLDITEDFLKKRHHDKFHLERVSINGEDLNDVYNQLDWPEVHKGADPFTIKLPIKKSLTNGKIIRLKERHTPNFLDSYLEYAMKVKGNPNLLNQINLEWDDEVEIPIPNVEDKDTIVSLATISSNAYVRFPKDDDEKKKLDWTDVGDWDPDRDNEDINFGWERDGMRGHVFVSQDNKTVVIGIKGTSGAGLPGTGEDVTAPNDKINDNLLFSCCCARVSYLWTTVCDCYENTYTCNQDCLEKELTRKDRYYQAVLDIYRNVTKIYPPESTDIWLTGHSLGGSLASLLGRTYGLPAVAFEAPGEMLATKRLHLPQPPGLPSYMENIWHFGNTADPIFMGVCNGASSSCSVSGYALETACHTGKQCVYDVVTDKGWKVSILNHRIHTVIDNIILEYNTTAPCIPQPPCRDCFNWRYTSHDDSESDEPTLPNPLRPLPTSVSSSRSNPECHMTSSPWISHSTSTCSPTHSSPSRPKKCLHRTWYGWCTEWGDEDGDD